ncbi:MAG: adenylyltransferase/cytidyltransferase family protein [Candidatus Saccharimonadales bacterium]
MKVGIYSGTFDPIHKGHVMFAQSTINEFGLDKVFFLPERSPRRKQGIKAYEHRVNMIKLALKKKNKLATVILEQPRFTPEQTMPIIGERFKGSEIYMLMGDDMLDHFIEWPNVGGLIKSVKFIVAVRKYDRDHIIEVIKIIEQVTGQNINFQIIEFGLNSYSSRSIRQSIKKNNDYKGLTKEVKKYIEDNGLYSALTAK